MKAIVVTYYELSTLQADPIRWLIGAKVPQLGRLKRPLEVKATLELFLTEEQAPAVTFLCWDRLKTFSGQLRLWYSWCPTSLIFSLLKVSNLQVLVPPYPLL